MIPEEIKSILLVDDDVISNLLSKVYINKLEINADVEVALNGKEALNYLTDENSSLPMPCLLLLDINMPVIDGWEFLDLYDKLIDQSVKDKIVIVMLTVSEAQCDMIKAKQNQHIVEYVSKPLSEKSLSNLINVHFKSGTDIDIEV
ncbi:response regulator [Aurantibacter crassamenti]|uniref:response regulator n=1 Tax=Aurantibacter crassamenti TaxID=1837375 RepID=UPI00193983D8|nr:response regulator [Aurantibacter crassamenti]MBM1107220.1 response regulator [Aurantibacter crassamenti]